MSSVLASDRPGRSTSARASPLDLELAVIGGGFSGVVYDYLHLVADGVGCRAVQAYAGHLRVVAAALGDQAPLLGAAALILAADRLSSLRSSPGV